MNHGSEFKTAGGGKGTALGGVARETPTNIAAALTSAVSTVLRFIGLSSLSYFPPASFRPESERHSGTGARTLQRQWSQGEKARNTTAGEAGNESQRAEPLRFLRGLEVRLERGAILLFRFELRLQLLHQQVETANFIAQLLNLSRRSCRSRSRRGRSGMRHHSRRCSGYRACSSLPRWGGRHGPSGKEIRQRQ